MKITITKSDWWYIQGQTFEVEDKIHIIAGSLHKCYKLKEPYISIWEFNQSKIKHWWVKVNDTKNNQLTLF